MTAQRPHILFAWELGANYGHAAGIAEVARALAGRARITVAAKDPVSFRQIAPDVAVDLLPAPRPQPRAAPAPEDQGRSFSDDLRHVGWGDARELATLLESWEALLRLVKPDIVAMDAAPTAALAMHGLDARRAMFGSGYNLPPRTDPLPPFFHWTEGAETGVAAREAGVVETANAALRLRRRAPLRRFADILSVDRYLLGCFPENDPYGPRTQFDDAAPTYFGQLSATGTGLPVAWRAGAGRRLFAYLRPAHGMTQMALGAFAALPPAWDCIVSVPGLPPAMQAALACPHLRLFDGPVRLAGVLADCDVAVSHGGGGFTGAALAAGAPQVCLPTQAEQVMAARTLATHGLSLGLIGNYGAKEIGGAVERVASLPAMRARARAVAERLKRQKLLSPGPRIAEELLRLA